MDNDNAKTLSSLSLYSAQNDLLKNSMDIQSSTVSRDIAEKNLSIQEEIFIPRFQADSTFERRRYNSLNVDNYLAWDIQLYTTGISRKNIFGGKESIHVTASMEEIEYIYSIESPKEYQSSFFMEYDQPVMQGRGKEITNAPIKKAKINLKRSEEENKIILSNTIFKMFNQYYYLYFINKRLSLQKKIRDRTFKLYKIIKQKVALRYMTITDLNRMKAAHIFQERKILELENQRDGYLQNLFLLIYNNSSQYRLDGTLQLVTCSKSLINLFKPASKEQTIEHVLAMDSFLISLEYSKKELEQDLLIALDRAKPKLDVVFQAGINGYDPNGLDGAFKDIDTANHFMAFKTSFEIPLKQDGNHARISIVKKQITNIDNSIKKRTAELKKEIIGIYDDLTDLDRQIAYSREIVALSKQNLENEVERLVQERTTVINLLDYQQELIASEYELLALKQEYLMLVGKYYHIRMELSWFINQTEIICCD
ncbi:TolC family protein [Desulfamplus magnetovallimortis]|uniref:TolC family protein n=1 Tax=Desulfamplus magnetovallimortis TaxID=1246637 RepID=UPI0016483D83|nr:TolC family protein [Desulfamplus magnetovallimortis]